MADTRPPLNFYLKRAIASYEQAGDPHAAAELLAEYGQLAAAAARFEALGNLAAAGEAYLSAGQVRAALDCFRRGRLPEGELRCLVALGDDVQAGVLLLELNRAAEAQPHLERALAAAATPVARATLELHLSRALLLGGQEQAGQAHYRAGFALLASLPAHASSAEAWAALGAWGQATGRQDRMQEGYAQALRILHATADRARRKQIAQHYHAAARACGNRRLARQLEEDFELAPTALVSADPAHGLLAVGQWAAALDQIEPRAATGEDAARLLLVQVLENPAAPLEFRLRAGTRLATAGDPRPGVCTLEPVWCGPFPDGEYLLSSGTLPIGRRMAERLSPLPFVRLALFSIARYPVTVWQFRRFVEDNGYTDQQWWTDGGWAWRMQDGITRPALWLEQDDTQLNCPVSGVSWYEAMAFCAWLTHRGRELGWLNASDVIRLPSEAEWAVAAMWDAQARNLRFWKLSMAEIWRNDTSAGIGRVTPVGLFPQGVSPCGALDMAGNVWEWCGSLYNYSYSQQLDDIQTDLNPYEGRYPALRGGAFDLSVAPPLTLGQKEAELDLLRRREGEAAHRRDFELAATLRTRYLQLQREFEQDREAWLQQIGSGTVDPSADWDACSWSNPARQDGLAGTRGFRVCLSAPPPVTEAEYDVE
jgi:tetratricopeptide (TPR) repeat protein